MGTRLSLPSFSPAKNPADYPAFKGNISRTIWRVLTQRLTPAGRWLGIATLVFASYGGASSLKLQTFVPAAYIAAVWVIAIAAAMLYRPRVKLTARAAARGSVGQSIPVDIDIEQLNRFRGADLHVMPHHLPPAIDAVPDDGVALPDLRRGENAKLRLGLRCTQRGKHMLRGFRVESGFPFGILRSRQVFQREQPIIVYPDFTTLSHLSLPSGRRYQPGGVAMASQLGESFEYLGNREYRDGDNARDIDWRATARVQRPIVREWVEEYMLRVAVVLDTHVDPKSKVDRSAAFEQAVSMAAAVSDYMARQDYLVDLFAAGPNLYHLTAGRSLAYLDQILEILACVDSSPTEPFETIEPQLGELMERISTVICVFLDWNPARQAFVQRIQMQGVAVKVIVVRDGRCTLDPAAEGEIAVLSTSDCAGGIEDV